MVSSAMNERKTSSHPPSGGPSSHESGFANSSLGEQWATLRSAWRTALAPIQAHAQPDKEERALLSLMTRVLMLGGVLALLVGVALGASRTYVALYAGLIGLCAVVLWAFPSDRRALAARVFVWGLFFLVATNALLYGGVWGAAVSAFFVLIGLGGWLAGRRTAVDLAVATAVALLLMGLAHASGHLGSDVSGSDFGQALFLSLMLVASTLIAVIGRASLEVHVRAQAKALQDLRASQSQLSKLGLAVDRAPGTIMIIGPGPRVEYVNRAFCAASGLAASEVLARHPMDVAQIVGLGDHYREAQAWIDRGQSWSGERSYQRADGSLIYERTLVVPMRNARNQVSHVMVLGQDVTSERLHEMHAQTLANFDAVTGLPSERHFMERASAALATARALGRWDAVAIVNVRRFKTLASAKGREHADATLRSAAAAITSALRSADLVARSSSAEFVVYLNGLSDDSAMALRNARNAALKIHRALAGVGGALAAHPEAAGAGIGGDTSAPIEAAIGVALVPMDAADTVAEAQRRAMVAALRAQEDARPSPTAVFAADLDGHVQEHYAIEQELRTGIQEGQLRLYVQPQVAANGRSVAAEALVRWQHPHRGLLMPDKFIGVAESSGLIVPLERWVLGEACAMLRRARSAGFEANISVNVSPRHFADDSFVDTIIATLTAHAVPSGCLTLEITEGVLVHDLDAAVAKMHALIARGVRFSLDDFGTGYSSLSYLRRLPLHEIKIDKVFVQDAVSQPHQAAIVEAILAVARTFSLGVVAEGVETPEQAQFIRSRAGNAALQGYLFCRPVTGLQWIERLPATGVATS